MRVQNNGYNTGLYCRLSRDDGNQTSMSIENQRQLLLDYVAENGWRVYDVYVDDGWSGTNFNRPDFKRMIRDVEDGKLDCIVTKDLSRLGRNYVQAGYYTEEYFIERGVRFIAINDSIDTMQEDNDIAAFHHVLNELYPKQVSKKVRQIKRAGARLGKFMNSHAPYGYQKSPQDKHVLIIDEEAAAIVRMIFSIFVSGDSVRNIAERLNRDGVDSPRFYQYKKLGKVNPFEKDKNLWNASSISQLMRNQAYIGNMVQGKRRVVSFKTKRREAVPPEIWIIVENTHEPIIDTETWVRVQKRLGKGSTRSKRVSSTGEVSLFSGLFMCADCGANMAFSERQFKSGATGVYKCQGYASKGRMACSSHYIKEETLIAHILGDISYNAKLAENDYQNIATVLANEKHESNQKTAKQLLKRQREIEKRIEVITSTLQKLYEDKRTGTLPEPVFQNMISSYISEQAELMAHQEENVKLLETRQDTERDVASWLSLVEQHKEIDYLDRCAAMELLESITIKESYDDDGIKNQVITINYRFIGNLPQKNQEGHHKDVLT